MHQDTIAVTTAIENLKTQRDLYTAFRDLFGRYDRLSADSVDALRRKVEALQGRIEALRAGQKPGFQTEVDKHVAGIEADNSMISALLARRVFIRACMWHELAVVFHSRQAGQAALGWRAWVQGTLGALDAENRVWERMNDDVGNMPLD
jgi:sorting nexin-8